MSDPIKHECGIVQIRLRKPVSFYAEKYGTDRYGLGKLYLMMEKQHNRGQEGAGVGCIKMNSKPGTEYIFRSRAIGSDAIKEVFSDINRDIAESGACTSDAKPYIGEIYIGHLRYSTTGCSGISYTHPFLRRNNWKSRNLCIAGNFNLTNVDEIFERIVACGQHPRHNADTFIMLEQLGSMLDEQVERYYRTFRSEGLSGEDLNQRIERSLDLRTILKEASESWDGGFVITGSTGSGDTFLFRDRWGIRPAFYYMDDEIFVAASERAVIQTAMNVETEQVQQLEPGAAVIIKSDGTVIHTRLHEPCNPRPCSFERIYFSRGSDRDVYRERKTLGRLLAEPILEEVNYDTDHTVFSFIPNTAEVAYYGMMSGMEDYLDRLKAKKIIELGSADPDKIQEILNHKIRTEKLAVKDIKLRTFITEGTSRDDLAAHVYDVTYGTITPHEDTVVVIDDSIVRGTTLKQSVIKILARLHPAKIVIVSSSPQVRYPDCYGIDMSRMEEFIAFNAAVELLEESGRGSMIDDIYNKCKAQAGEPKENMVNHVKEIYAPFTDREISDRIARMVTPEDCPCEVRLVFQSIEGLHEACPGNEGDWYFSGNYPTAGGNRVVNNSFINFYENIYIPRSRSLNK